LNRVQDDRGWTRTSGRPASPGAPPTGGAIQALPCSLAVRRRV